MSNKEWDLISYNQSEALNTSLKEAEEIDRDEYACLMVERMHSVLVKFGGRTTDGEEVQFFDDFL